MDVVKNSLIEFMIGCKKYLVDNWNLSYGQILSYLF